MTGMTFVEWFLAAGVAQGVFLCLVLSSMSVRNSRARWLLVGCIGTIVLPLGLELFDAAGAPSGFGVGLLTEFALAPTLYLFMSALAEDESKLIRKSLWHFSPLGVGVLWLLYLNLGFESHGADLSGSAVKPLIAATVAVKAVYFITYAILMLRRPLALETKPQAARNALCAVKRFVAALCAAYGITVLSFAAFYIWPNDFPDSDWIGALALVGAVFALAHFCIVERSVFDLASTKKDEPTPVPPDAALFERARRHLEESQAFLDPEFSLTCLAAALGVPDGRLSTALNAAFEGGFYALINEQRLRAYFALARDPRRSADSILTLAMEAGFGSKATFYRYFRSRLGTTPSKHRRVRFTIDIASSEAFAEPAPRPAPLGK